MEASWVHTFHSDPWIVDAQILADLLGILSNIEELSLNIGTTFAPEHFDDIFSIARPSLKSLSIIFRPYVQKATYYQFLKGSYFDNLLTHVASWPSDSQLQRLSIVQTSLPEMSSHFAQPIVFFSLQPLTELVSSPALRKTTHFRFSVPSRPIADAIRTPKPRLDAVTLLDLSTTSVNPNAISKTLLAQFPNLVHLILDECAVVSRATELTGEFSTLGQLCATSPIDKARSREKKLKEIAALRRTAIESASVSNPTTEASAPTQPKKSKKGRRGLAAPAFSLREKVCDNQVPVVDSSTPIGADTIILLEKVRILPIQGKLQTLCTTVFAAPTQEQIDFWQGEFAAGWTKGSRSLEAVQKRFFSSLAHHLIRLFRFATPEEQLQPKEDEMLKLSELEDLVEVTTEEFEVYLQMPIQPPRLCFGGMEGVPH
ncbi:hypothetical protein FS842_009437, partial [Serendipita sp. 407]